MLDDTFSQLCSVSTATGGSTSAGRTLRRRRSAASAALLSKPSMLTLGELVPSFETCVLVYLTSSPTTTRLVYALFEPNFLIDGSSQTVRKLDRSSWERLRSHVEELRIVALSSRFDDAGSEPGEPTTPTRKPDCVFDLSIPTDDTAQMVTRMYLQPQSYTAVPARSKEDLLEIEIHAPCEGGVAEERRSCLPAQVRAVLQDAEGLIQQGNAGLVPMSAPAVGGAQRGQDAGITAGYAKTCDRILELVQSTDSAS